MKSLALSSSLLAYAGSLSSCEHVLPSGSLLAGSILFTLMGPLGSAPSPPGGNPGVTATNSKNALRSGCLASRSVSRSHAYGFDSAVYSNPGSTHARSSSMLHSTSSVPHVRRAISAAVKLASAAMGNTSERPARNPRTCAATPSRSAKAHARRWYASTLRQSTTSEEDSPPPASKSGWPETGQWYDKLASAAVSAASSEAAASE